eukprot:UN02423
MFDSSGLQCEQAPLVFVKQESNKKTKVITLLIFIVVLALAVIIVLSIKLSESNESKAVPIEEYVLPSDTLFVKVDTEIEISGHLLADDINYHFASISNITTEGVVFYNINTAPNSEKWAGFKLNHLSEKRSEFNIYDSAGDTTKIAFEGNVSVTETQQAMIKSFFSSNVAKHYVELSIKLSSFGYLGNMNKVIHSIHSSAEWIFMVAQNENVDWILFLDDEVSKTNDIIYSSRQQGHWISDTQQLQLDDMESRRIRRLGNCGSPISHCENKCYGRCGPDCTCWRAICGGCECWQGCYAHDYYCSCSGLWHPWCVNVLWITCSYSGWDSYNNL